MNGKPLWKADVGSKTHGWGSAASPILYKDLLIVNASIESSRVVALDKRTGQQRWAVSGISDSWSTPLVVTLPNGPLPNGPLPNGPLPNGRDELVVSMHSKIFGIDPATGKKLWTCAGVEDYVCPSVIAHGDVVFVSSGRRPLTLAVRCGGRGDVSETHILWELRKTPAVPTPLYHAGHLYWLDKRAVACVVDAKTGKAVTNKTIKDLGTAYASMVLADGRLYALSRERGAVVLAADPALKELARNSLGDDTVFNGTPAIDAGQLLIRSDAFLYCIGN